MDLDKIVEKKKKVYTAYTVPGHKWILCILIAICIILPPSDSVLYMLIN